MHRLARRLWDFHTAPASTGGDQDLLLVLGSHDLRVAAHAGRLWAAGLAPLVVFSGDRGRRTTGTDDHGRWQRPEAEEFAETAKAASGMPDSALLLETRATNTGENFALSRGLTTARGLSVRRAAVTAKPYMGQRALATAAVHWPGVTWTFHCFPGGYPGYPNEDHPAGELVHFLVGDLQRLGVYARRGWSAPVDIPAEVREAYVRLVARGFTAHLLPDEPAEAVSG